MLALIIGEPGAPMAAESSEIEEAGVERLPFATITSGKFEVNKSSYSAARNHVLTLVIAAKVRMFYGHILVLEASTWKILVRNHKKRG